VAPLVVRSGVRPGGQTRLASTCESRRRTGSQPPWTLLTLGEWCDGRLGRSPGTSALAFNRGLIPRPPRVANRRWVACPVGASACPPDARRRLGKPNVHTLGTINVRSACPHMPARSLEDRAWGRWRTRQATDFADWCAKQVATTNVETGNASCNNPPTMASRPRATKTAGSRRTWAQETYQLARPTR
jgi:hypothetical protein